MSSLLSQRRFPQPSIADAPPVKVERRDVMATRANVTRECNFRDVPASDPMHLSQHPRISRFHLDTNANDVIDTVVTAQVSLLGNQLSASLKAVETLPDCDLPADRDARDVPADVVERCLIAAVQGA